MYKDSQELQYRRRIVFEEAGSYDVIPKDYILGTTVTNTSFKLQLIQAWGNVSGQNPLRLAYGTLEGHDSPGTNRRAAASILPPQNQWITYGEGGPNITVDSCKTLDLVFKVRYLIAQATVNATGQLVEMQRDTIKVAKPAQPLEVGSSSQKQD